ncbi:hypothetical protein PRIPAC_93448 [Pristionchus pacificus]|uniref:Uncharacterized protein n=1 Tax=Pristionchus pacificus TaxID=54126 RepID=A0A2A6BBN7_PRIPA|nr:hypothetical protein PRIPAC_93448 [Pristionchus pacificus]|eukprot:PDM63289.1 hypothetical protein PRIPAC_50504 [Pristionchus pacificus]
MLFIDHHRHWDPRGDLRKLQSGRERTQMMRMMRSPGCSSLAMTDWDPSIWVGPFNQNRGTHPHLILRHHRWLRVQLNRRGAHMRQRVVPAAPPHHELQLHAANIGVAFQLCSCPDPSSLQ